MDLSFNGEVFHHTSRILDASPFDGVSLSSNAADLEVKITVNEALPAIAPKGTYKAHVTVVDSNSGAMLSCGECLSLFLFCFSLSRGFSIYYPLPLFSLLCSHAHMYTATFNIEDSNSKHAAPSTSGYDSGDDNNHNGGGGGGGGGNNNSWDPHQSAQWSDQQIHDHNNSGATWTAGVNEFTKDKTLGQVANILGTILTPPTTPRGANLAAVIEPLYQPASIPTSFNSATNWPSCAARINKIENQGQCGSCWAFSAVETLQV